jgi:hypothetical protein
MPSMGHAQNHVGWNIFTGGSPDADIMRRLKRYKRPFYLAMEDLCVNNNASRPLVVMYFVGVDAAIDDIPKDLSRLVKPFKNYNDRAWVEDVWRGGKFNGVNVFILGAR